MEKFLVQQKWEKNRRPSISVLLARRHSKIGPKFVFCLFFFFTLVFFSTSGRRKGRLRAATSKKKYLASKTTNRISSISVRRRRRWKIRSIRRHFLFQSLLNGTQCRSPSARFTFPRLDFAQIWLNLIVEFDCSRPFFFGPYLHLVMLINCCYWVLLGFTGFLLDFIGFQVMDEVTLDDLTSTNGTSREIDGNFRWFFFRPLPPPNVCSRNFLFEPPVGLFYLFFFGKGEERFQFCFVWVCVCVCVCAPSVAS